MPNYPTHARWGRIGAGVMALAVGSAIFVLFASIPMAIASAVGAGVTTFVGAIYPDVDHHNSIPRRKAVRAFQVLVCCGVVSLAVLHWGTLTSIAETALVNPSETASSAFLGSEIELPPGLAASAVIFVAAGVLAILVDPTLDLVTRKHRGWTHSAPINTVLIALLAGAVWALTNSLPEVRQVAATAVVATFLIGTLIHLGLDGEIV